MEAGQLVERSAAFTPGTSCRGYGWIRVHTDGVLEQSCQARPEDVETLDLSANNLAAPRSLAPMAPFTRLRALSLLALRARYLTSASPPPSCHSTSILHRLESEAEEQADSVRASGAAARRDGGCADVGGGAATRCLWRWCGGGGDGEGGNDDSSSALNKYSCR